MNKNKLKKRHEWTTRELKAIIEICRINISRKNNKKVTSHNMSHMKRGEDARLILHQFLS